MERSVEKAEGDKGVVSASSRVVMGEGRGEEGFLEEEEVRHCHCGGKQGAPVQRPGDLVKAGFGSGSKRNTGLQQQGER